MEEQFSSSSSTFAVRGAVLHVLADLKTEEVERLIPQGIRILAAGRPGDGRHTRLPLLQVRGDSQFAVSTRTVHFRVIETHLEMLVSQFLIYHPSSAKLVSQYGF